MAFKINFNGQTLGEEIANSVSHGVGALLAIAGTAVMIVTACLTSDAYGIVSAALYGFFTILLYLFSTIYHSLTNTKAKKVFQILDHCTIYILIAGTYTPILLADIVPGNPLIGWGLLTMQWVVSAVAISLNAIDLHRYRYVSYAAYLILGWAIVIIAPLALKIMHPQALWFLLIGGISYTAGAVTFLIGIRRRYFHCIFHIFVLIGSFLQFIGIYQYIL